MKNILNTLLVTFILLSFSQTFAEVTSTTISSSAPISWSVAEDTTWKWYWWKLVFPNSTVWVKVNASSLKTNPSSDISISWNFWMQNVSSTTDGSLWWATFDIWTIPWAPKVILDNQWNNTFLFKWYAWSKAAGWIYFWDDIKDASNNLIPNSKVVYDRTAWKITWCWWSENLGWICLDGLNLDTTPADLTNIATYTAADHQKNINISDDVKILIITNQAWIEQPNLDKYDLRKIWKYDISVEDKSWNISQWNIYVVANEPSMTWYDWVTASEFSLTTWTKIWDGNQVHNVNFTLKDRYWNVIKNVAWVKDVKVWITFNNTVDLNQIDDDFSNPWNLNIWDAINFKNNPFSLYNWVTKTWTWYREWWDYNIDISSYAPTKSAYNYTTDNNDISIANITVKVTSLSWTISWIWEWTNNSIFNSNYSNKNFNFLPTLKVDNITNSDNWNILRDTTTYFTGSVSLNKSSWAWDISNLNIRHMLNAWDNTFLSFQNINWLNEKCVWYNTSTWWYNRFWNWDFCWEPLLNRYSFITKTDIWTNWFNGMLRIISPWVNNYDVIYDSDILYNIDGNKVSYPSMSYSSNQTLVNNEVKIAWITNTNSKSFNVISDSSIKSIWDVIKMDVYTAIRKNIVPYQKSGSAGKVYYTTASIDINDSKFSTYDTIIVDWADAKIIWNINKVSWKIKSIISLKNTSWEWWNIWIWNNVKFVWAILVADKSLLSWDWINYSSDTWNAKNQLFIKWSVISFNTIWWASKTPPSCPYYITSTCDIKEAKRYDYNHLRSFVSETVSWAWSKVDWTTYWVDMTLPWYSTAPVIIEYDSEVSKNIPNVFKIQ